MNICVFLGPSLELDIAKTLLTAEFHPPVKMGDVYRICSHSPDAIVIIDGIFEQTPAVWHKEILYALDKGIPVFGASSMGALRAAELCSFGMIGIGKIYNDFNSGRFEDDDEVAVVHASDGQHMVQSEAMVNIRYGLERAVQENIIAHEKANHLIDFAKSQFYPERSWASVIKELERFDAALSEPLKIFLEQMMPNQKRDDAIKCLEAVNRLATGYNLPLVEKSFHFESTVYWETVEKYFGFEEDQADTVMTEKLRNHIRIFPANRKAIVQQSLFYHFVETEAKRLGINKVDDKLALQRFRYQRKLHSSQALASWLVAHQISNKECLTVARLEYLTSLLEIYYISAVDSKLTLSTKVLGQFKNVYEDVKAKQALLKEWGIDNPSEADVGSKENVLDWYQEKFGSEGLGLIKHMNNLGFGEPRIFFNELYEHYLFHQNTTSASAEIGGSHDTASRPI